VKRLTVAFLVLSIFASTVFAQSADEVIKVRLRVFVGWLEIVKTAESKYKSEHGVYGDLTALRDAHLVDALVFASSTPRETAPDSSLIPKSTYFQVTASIDGQHYKIAIQERLDVGNVSLSADEVSTGWGISHPPHLPQEDGPEGPLISLAG
jgi:hypothetical protein